MQTVCKPKVFIGYKPCANHVQTRFKLSALAIKLLRQMKFQGNRYLKNVEFNILKE